MVKKEPTTNYQLSTTTPALLVIVGPTASGKSDLAIKVAKNFNGEIISADSLTIYKDMDIGTAKPTKKDQEIVKHWGLDMFGPGQRFTAADFKRYAQKRIVDIQKRGCLPVVVGGTGLYIDSLIFDFSFGDEADLQIRRELEKLDTKQLQSRISELGYKMPQNQTNRRHLTRAIERKGIDGDKKIKPAKGILLVGLLPENEQLKRKIDRRVGQMFDDGIINETQHLLKLYGQQSLLAKAKVAYGPVVEYLLGTSNMEEAKERLKTAHWQYARRQRTWFKRNRYINWFNDSNEAFNFIKKLL